MVLRIEKASKSSVGGGIGSVRIATPAETLRIGPMRNIGGTNGLLKGVLP
jgi:hypothetical protein